jgi:ribonuclease E
MESKNKMLIDATHTEETRVVVLRNGRVEEFDYESAARKLLRGNIYLAKVTRVEPSLQAAFVDYGGNRHGFLAFSEIHPDYYQIPVADRQALLQQEAEAEAEEMEAEEAEAEARAERRGRTRARHAAELRYPDEADDAVGEPSGAAPEAAPAEAGPGEPSLTAEPQNSPDNPDHTGAEAPSEAVGADAEGEEPGREGRAEGHVEEVNGDSGEAPETVGASAEQMGGEDALEEVPERPRRHIRSYKIQEVIKRRQIILVQVVKEERGSKGAALTTYLSLAGRYTVLMPNTGRGGGISRKITNPQDRKRLKAIAQDLEVPEGMGLIIRTAGAARTKQEIKRDFEYLLRLWENVRDLTLQSTAPSLVYEEGNLIKRSIRDLYSKDIDEILVAGEAAHREAQDFMRMLSPSQARHVVKYEEPESLFARFHIERQLNAMFSPYVTLRSGGYLVINQTEALVAIDVNSGKATREFSIEETALQTNLEAAEEVARQVKLRDLAGLIVIDFIDMEERRNNRRVESRLKDALRHDRARIQVGRISHFGLLEMSRQRLRTGVMEGSTSQCPHCQGTGIVRSTESVALAVLRALEDYLARDARSSLMAVTTADVALYILNNKRAFITDMEHRYGIVIAVQAGERMQGANFAIEKSAAPVAAPKAAERSAAVNMEWGFEGRESEETYADSEEAEAQPEGETETETETDGRRPRRRRRRGRREDRAEPRGREEPAGFANGEADLAQHEPHHEDEGLNGRQDASGDIPGLGDQPAASGGEDERRGRRRRRGRRGGRRGRDRDAALPDETGAEADAEGVHDGAPEHAENGAEVEASSAAPEGQVAAAPPSASPEAPERHAAPGPAEAGGPAVAGDPGPDLHERAPEHEPLPQAAHGRGGAPVSEPHPEPAVAESGAEPGHAATEPEPASPGPASYEPAQPSYAQPDAPAPHVEPAPAGDPAHTDPAPDDPSRPARKGWWQRRASGS